MPSFDVRGMSCGHCVKTVTAAVHQVDPSARVDIDLATGLVKVESTQPAATKAAEEEEAGGEGSTGSRKEGG